MTVIAAMGLCEVRAPLLIEGAINAATFLMYVEQVLVPALRRGDVVIFDNLSSHLSPAVSEAIGRAGASVLPLPPYSPDFNPIEEMFSQFKGFLRRVGAEPRSTSTTPSERDYERSDPRTSSAGSGTPDCASCRRDPL